MQIRPPAACQAGVLGRHSDGAALWRLQFKPSQEPVNSLRGHGLGARLATVRLDPTVALVPTEQGCHTLNMAARGQSVCRLDPDTTIGSVSAVACSA